MITRVASNITWAAGLLVRAVLPHQAGEYADLPLQSHGLEVIPLSLLSKLVTTALDN